MYIYTQNGNGQSIQLLISTTGSGNWYNHLKNTLIVYHRRIYKILTPTPTSELMIYTQTSQTHPNKLVVPNP
jgi:hypothetical protein